MALKQSAAYSHRRAQNADRVLLLGNQVVRQCTMCIEVLLDFRAKTPYLHFVLAYESAVLQSLNTKIIPTAAL